MRSVELTLLSFNYEKDSIGQEIKKQKRKKIPIIKQTSIMFEEFYEANEHGLRPEARFVVSALNYNNEREIEYMGNRYSVIRATTTNPDEVSLICERKVGNVISESGN